MGSSVRVSTAWRRRTRMVLASAAALGVTAGFAGVSGAATSPNAPDSACIGSHLSTNAQYWYNYDELLGSRAWFYHAAAVDPEFWDQYGIDPGDFGADPVYSVSSSARSRLINADNLAAVSGCS